MASAFYASFCGSRLSASILFIPVSTVQMKIELVVDTLLVTNESDFAIGEQRKKRIGSPRNISMTGCKRLGAADLEAKSRTESSSLVD